MKAFLIDPIQQSINEVEYSGNFRDIYKLIGADCFDAARSFRNGDVIYVDDEGLLKGPVYQFFGMKGYGNPLAGKGLVLGTNDEGESVAPKSTIEQIQSRLLWIERLSSDIMGVTTFSSSSTDLVPIRLIHEHLARMK